MQLDLQCFEQLNERRKMREQFYSEVAPYFQYAMTSAEKVEQPDFSVVAPNFNPYIIYIHFPFCTSICTNCPYSRVVQPDLIADYCKSLIKEIEYIGECIPANVKPDCVYFGGGTPSLIPIEYMEEIMEKLHTYLIRGNDCQVSYEVNPETLDVSNLKRLRDLGINRISLGVQTFDDGLLKKLNRRYGREKAEKAVAAVKDCFNYNIDLMYCMDGQSEELFFKDLEQALAVKPNHISVFPHHSRGDGLSDHEKTVLEIAKRNIYYKMQKVLAANNYVQYSVFDYGYNGSKSVYNFNSQKTDESETLVLGTATFGSTAQRGYYKYRDIDKYIESIGRRIPPVYFLKSDEAVETRVPVRFFMALHAMEMDRPEFKRRYGVDPAEGGDVFFQFMKSMDMLEVTEEKVRLSPDGVCDYQALFNHLYFYDLIPLTLKG